MSEEEKKPQRWLPIECSPEIMNKFLHGCGLSKKWAITDVFGLDEELLAMIPTPVVGFLLLFPMNAVDKISKGEVVKGKDDIFFMKQTISNACGTVAMIHCVANNLDTVELNEGYLMNFLESSKDKDLAERAVLLEENEEVCLAHDKAAHEGQTAPPNLYDIVNYHFVAIIEKDGEIYELDGRREGPISHGASSKETFVSDAARVCREYMERDPENIKFSVLALAAAD